MKASTSITATVALVSTAMAADPLGPGSGPWAEEDPASHGMDIARLEKAWNYLQETATGRGCMVVVKNGAIVYEEYNDALSYSKDRATMAFSSSKTLGAMLTGIPVREGVLDIDAPIDATYGVKTPVDYDVTARQIMAQDIGGAKAGEKWEYDFAGDRWINTLPKVLRATMNEDPADVWEREFVKPLGLSKEFYWGAPFSVNDNFAFGSGGTCRDFARFGQLLLNEGKWAGHDPILPQDYVKAMITPQARESGTSEYSSTCYGLLTWTSYAPNKATTPGQCLLPTQETVDESKSGYPDAVPKDVNVIIGALGQITMQFPSENMTVTTMGFTPPRAQVYPHQMAARVAEAAYCEALSGDRCGKDWDRKTGAEVRGDQTVGEQEIIQNLREEIAGIPGIGGRILAAVVPDALLEQLVFLIVRQPTLITTVSTCIRGCLGGADLHCRASCLTAAGVVLEAFGLGVPEEVAQAIRTIFVSLLAPGETLSSSLDIERIANVLASDLQPDEITAELLEVGVPASVANSDRVTSELVHSVRTAAKNLIRSSESESLHARERREIRDDSAETRDDSAETRDDSAAATLVSLSALGLCAASIMGFFV